MKLTALRRYSLFLFLIVSLSFSGCFHGGFKNIKSDQEALQLLSTLQTNNSALITFKGIGSVKLKSKGQNNALRLAWAGKSPDKLRLIVLFSGKPIETFAADGKRIYLKSHTGQHKFIKHKSSNASLKKLINIPVTTKEIIKLMTGRLPLPDYRRATLTKSADGNGWVIDLYRPWRGIVAKVFLNKDKELNGYARIKGDKTLYSVQLNDFRQLNGFSLPNTILINTDEASCKIICSKYFTNPDVKPEIFTLNK